jgi:hypothetical protein
MNTHKRVQRIGIILAISIALLLSGTWLAGAVNAQSPGRVAGQGMGAMMGRNVASYPMGATMAFTDSSPNGDPDNAWDMGHGMMHSYMMGGYMMAHHSMDCPMGMTTAITNTLPYGYPGYGDPDGSWGMGHHGMMHGMWRGAMTTGQAVTGVDDARLLAQEYLTKNVRGVTLGDPITPRPGGYRFTILRDGKIVGIIRVNASSGEVWYDAWD